MMSLAELHALLPGLIEDGLSELADPESRDAGSVCAELCVLYRARGVTALLIDLNVDEFHHMLTRSGLTWSYALERMPSETKSRSALAKLSRTQAFFDSVAIGRVDIARRIGAASARGWISQYEYEDDFCYALFLHRMVAGADPKELEDVLRRFERALEQKAATNFDICQALMSRSQYAFTSAWTHKLAEWDQAMKFEEKSPSRDDFAFLTGRHVYVEGLAVLRLAESIGLATEPEYKYCPNEARLTSKTPFPDDGYPR